jgi:hypothetical protein
MALRKFGEFIQGRQRTVSRRLELDVLEEETDDQDITRCTTVIIGSDLSTDERQSLRDGLINYTTKMSERGDTIIAIAVLRGLRYDRDFE